MDVLSLTLPIFSLIAVGWGCVRLGFFGPGVSGGLSQFVYWLAFPALLLTSMAKAPAPDSAMVIYMVLWAGLLLTTQMLGRFGARILKADQQSRAGIAMASSCGNTAFLGTALLVSALGAQILPLAAAFVAVENILVVGSAVAGLRLSQGPKSSLANTFQMLAKGAFNPTSVGALIGLLLALARQPLPSELSRPLELLGGAASPAGLVALGAIMASMDLKKNQNSVETLLVVGLKCLILPAMMWTGFTLLNAPANVVLAATILAACPSAVNVFIQAQQAKIWADQAAKAVFATTLVSLFTISLAMTLLT